MDVASSHTHDASQAPVPRRSPTRHSPILTRTRSATGLLSEPGDDSTLTKPSTVEILEGIDKDIQILEEYSEKYQRQLKIWVGRLLLYSSLLFLLEEVMETETYKNAKLILERFDPDSKRKNRNVNPKTPSVVNSANGAAARPPLTSGLTYPGRSSHSAPGGPPERSLSAIAAQQSLMRRPVTPGTPVPGAGMHPPGPPMARPVVPRERGALDRVIEYLVGDGPQNRYALICQQCLSHNGMALKEEFEYVAFRCAYCYFLNPARKTRPQAPRLAEATGEVKMTAEATVPSSAADGDEDPSVSGETGNIGTPTTTEPSSASDSQSTPESRDLPSEKSDGELDVSAMEVE
ncbi:Protein lunapark-A [Liparis tanakae]|uniref:Endoplasmic reticulum junction formation protein lunapark n=1 Tax=Liparis tanakae TaxID=230148 RepID=A0A4Z2H3B5_9TELE|nr:Protein lunapark-A [Liparis tanakae]